MYQRRPRGPQRGQVAISATNRNMPGRMGEGDAYLANPYVVAASAVQGRICGPEDLPPATDLHQFNISTRLFYFTWPRPYCITFDLNLQIEELGDRIAPDGGETVCHFL